MLETIPLFNQLILFLFADLGWVIEKTNLFYFHRFLKRLQYHNLKLKLRISKNAQHIKYEHYRRQINCRLCKHLLPFSVLDLAINGISKISSYPQEKLRLFPISSLVFLCVFTSQWDLKRGINSYPMQNSKGREISWRIFGRVTWFNTSVLFSWGRAS